METTVHRKKSGASGGKAKAEKSLMSAAAMYSMVEAAPLNILYANRDGIMIYANKRSLETLKRLEKYMPVPVSEMVGQSIDVFHRNPSHQKKILANERNLPHKAIIQLGPEKLELLVSAVVDEKGNYIGPMVTWDIVTERLKMEQLNADFAALNAALSKTQATIEFQPDGTIVTANENFLKALGYSLNEITGRHHSMFCDPAWVSSPKYKEFWAKLGHGTFDQGQYKRITKDGREVWIQASYNPVIDANGRVVRVVKLATEITKQKKEQLELISSLEDTAGQLAASSEELSAVASQMTKNASLTAEKSNSAAAASEEVSKGVQTVATNTEEMVASIKEISKSSNEAAGISKDAMRRAQDTNATISQLGEASQEIGNVIKVISSIAQQTNLLALNATIEAARAGDAGKGFAVVANEVKELAKQTAKATEDITNKIGAIQESSKNAVGAIGAIAKVIEQINGISMTIAAAVEEQTATTNEVSRVMQESSSAVEGITGTVKIVATAAADSEVGASQTLDSSRGLSELASKLRDLVKRIGT